MSDSQGNNQATIVLSIVVVGLMLVLAILGAAFLLTRPELTPQPARESVAEVPDQKSQPREVRQTSISDDEQQIREMLEAWRLSWERFDLDRFMSLYSPDFRGEGMGWTEWRAEKRRSFAKYTDISVYVRDVEVHVTGSEAELSFNQSYSGAGSGGSYSSDGRKHMAMRKEQGDWLIVGERFYKM